MIKAAPSNSAVIAPPEALPALSLLDPALMCLPRSWAAFAPTLHVCDADFLASFTPLNLCDDALKSAEQHLGREGYFQLPPADWAMSLTSMADVVHRLAMVGAPPVLAYHFDEFWLMFSRLRPLLCALLGDDPVMLPAFWAWHVDPGRQEAGWTPHRDKVNGSPRVDRRSKIITLWLALTDATPLNSCIYIVPADRDPTYNTDRENQLLFNMTDIRALPAEAGSILGWDQAVLHWGSHAADRTCQPRISIAGEFQRSDVEPNGAALLDPLRPPDFATRQILIGRQMLRYQHMAPAGKDWQSCAESMARGVAARR